MALTFENASSGHMLPSTKTDKISYLIDLWAIPVILGIPGNVLAIIVSTRPQNRKLSPSIYIAAMGVVETIFLLDRTVAIVLNKLLLANMIDTDPTWWFRSQVFVFHTTTILSGLFLAGMSVDRLIAVRFPMDAKRLCTTKRAKITIASLSFLVILLNIHIFYMIHYFRDDKLGMYATVLSFPQLPELELVVTGYYTAVGTVFPFIIIFTSNILIIITLRKASHERQKIESTKNIRLEKSTQYLTRMLIFVSLAYVVLTLPWRLYHLLMRIPAIAYDLSDLYWKKRYIMQSWFLGLIWMLNYACNFYLYCIGGGQKYRQEAKNVILNILNCKC